VKYKYKEKKSGRLGKVWSTIRPDVPRKEKKEKNVMAEQRDSFKEIRVIMVVKIVGDTHAGAKVKKKSNPER